MERSVVVWVSLAGFRLCEFHDEVGQDLPFYCSFWLVFDVELAHLYGPLHQSSGVSGLCNTCFIGYSVGTSMV